MTGTIAIHPDSVRHRNGRHQSFSRRWGELAGQTGFTVREVDAYSPALFGALEGCDGFMWRFGYDPLSLQFAKRLLPAIEHGRRMPVFPSWKTAWTFEDKIAQLYLLQASGVPMPATRVLWDMPSAERYCREAAYPLVLKLSYGIQSANVRLIHSADEALGLARLMFGPGLTSLQPPSSFIRRALRSNERGLRLLAGRPLPRNVQHGYLYVQEFLPGNAFDTRVTVIGDRAFAFRRFNRPDDFRASGSGRIDWDPARIDLDAVRIAFRVARHLETQSIALDVLRRDGENVVGEISYTYASWAVEACPGHWKLSGDHATGSLAWVEGTLAPEDAIFEDFADRLRTGGGSTGVSAGRPLPAGQ